MNKTFCRIGFLCAAALMLAACSPSRTGLSGGTLGMNTIPGLAVSASSPYTPAESGRLWASATTNDMMNAPLVSFDYVFYRDANRPEAVAYAAIATLQDVDKWNFVPQPSLIPDTFGPVTTVGDASLFGTVRNLCIPAASDWASRTLQAGGRSTSTPEEWLARRWVYSLDNGTRAVAEYREPKPDWLETRDSGILLVGEQDANYLREFQKRADAVFTVARTQGGANDPLPVVTGPLPDVARIAGEIIKADRSDDSGAID